MKEFAKAFYKSKVWQNTRDAYASSVGWLCEDCMTKGLYKAGEIVHHKDGNILNNDPVNLEVLSSQSEHCRVHGFGKKKGGGVDEHFQ